MKSILICAALAAACNSCPAADVWSPSVDDNFEVERMPFGSGTPASAATTGTETANHVADGLYHVPNYLPGFPTAATIWPRELPLECVQDAATRKPSCTGYEVLPATGRGEYIFVRPVMKVAAPAPAPVAPQPLPVARKRTLG